MEWSDPLSSSAQQLLVFFVSGVWVLSYHPFSSPLLLTVGIVGVVLFCFECCQTHPRGALIHKHPSIITVIPLAHSSLQWYLSLTHHYSDTSGSLIITLIPLAHSSLLWYLWLIHHYCDTSGSFIITVIPLAHSLRVCLGSIFICSSCTIPFPLANSIHILFSYFHLAQYPSHLLTVYTFLFVRSSSLLLLFFKCKMTVSLCDLMVTKDL